MSESRDVILLRHGLKQNLGPMKEAEPVFITDEDRLYIGKGEEEFPVPVDSRDEIEVLTRDLEKRLNLFKTLIHDNHQVSDKKIKRDYYDLVDQIAIVNSRVSNILVPSGSNVTQEEIIDAREGQESLYDNLRRIRTEIESLEFNFNNRAYYFDTVVDMRAHDDILIEGDRCWVLLAPPTKELDVEEEVTVTAVYGISTMDGVPSDTAEVDIIVLNQDLVAFKIAEIQGGGGYGSGGGITNTAVMRVLNNSGWIHKSSLRGDEVNISIQWSSLEEGISTGRGIMRIIINGIQRYSTGVSQGFVTQDVSDYLVLGSNNIQVEVADSYGNRRSLRVQVDLFDLVITSSFDNNLIYTQDVRFSYTVYGEGTKTVHFLLNGVEVGTREVTTSGREASYLLPRLSHGANSLEVYYTTELNNEEVRSNTLYYEIIFVGDSTETIIASDLRVTEFDQYQTINIPYRVYTPNRLTSDVLLKVDGQVVGDINVSRTERVWSYRFENSGLVRLTIESGGVSRDFDLNIIPTDITIEAETEGLELYLSALGKSNSSIDRDKWEFDGIKAEFRSFNWDTGGWLEDKEGFTHLKVTGDSRVYIPFDLFSGDIRTTGKTIEFEMSTSDVMNYEASVISSMDGGVGFDIQAQKAIFHTQQSYVETRYKEEEHVRISFVVEKRSGHRLIHCYVNGILSRTIQYANNDLISHNKPTGIIIGSNECNVSIYNMRVYRNDLDHKQILDNWIADTQSSSLLLDRYHRNDIFDSYGNISISKLPANLPYMIFTAPDLPIQKGDKKIVSGSFTNPLDRSRNFTFENTRIDVQGTSSQYYSRKNYKINFDSGIVDEEGETYDGFDVKKGGIRADVFTLKADVASSEGANNVVLVDIFNELSPFKTTAQINDSRVRQGIAGFPMLVFHDDGKSTKFLGKYNFNDDEKSNKIFGFEGEVTAWEIENNTSDRVLFKSSDFSIGDWTDDFDSRYPKDNPHYQPLQEMVAWVESTDRTQATDSLLDTPVTYGTITHTNDTAEYRLDKFRNEFHDWFEEGSTVYWYLFTELFLMVDSRAKNTFPTRFPGQKWSWQAYDMDTALGINNEGELIFDYHLEDTDSDGDKDVFNGKDSVMWLNVRDAFYNEIKDMYLALRSAGKLSYEWINNKFETHQSAWSEAVFNEDGFYKYIEPIKESNDLEYLGMIQGSKAEQRKWWLYNRFKYMDSKFHAPAAKDDVITLRGYAKADLEITPYADIYASVLYGSYFEQVRALRGQSYLIPNRLDNVNDTEIYIYSASQLKSIGDISGLKVGYANFSFANKLQELKIGDKSPDYTNTNLISLNVGNNNLLRLLDVRNCTSLSDNVNISGCPNVEEVYFQGTNIAGLTLPKGGHIKELHLPDTIKNLTVINQKRLVNFTLAGYQNIDTLRVEGSPKVDIGDIIENAPNLARVRLLNINEVFSNVDVLDRLSMMSGLDENDNVLPNAVITGRVHITGQVRQAQVNRFRELFPELYITYDSISYGIRVRFYGWDNVLLDTQMVSHGMSAVDPVTSGRIEVPTRPGDIDRDTYYYKEWDKNFDTITDDLDIYAVFSTPVVVRIYYNNLMIHESEEEPRKPFIYEGNIEGLLYERDMYLGMSYSRTGDIIVGDIVPESDMNLYVITRELASTYSLASDDDFEWVSGYTYSGGYRHDITKDIGCYKYTGVATDVIIPNTISNHVVRSTSRMFVGTNVKRVANKLQGNITDTQYMFYNSKATSLDLSDFDTSNVTTMSQMFYNSKATSLDLSDFDTSNVTTMSQMFYGSEATSLDLSDFDTSNVTNMSKMFESSRVTSLDLSDFDTSNVTNMSQMFERSRVTSLDVSGFDTSNVTNMNSMFYNCSSTILDVSGFDTSNVTSMYRMFESTRVTSLDVSGFDTSNVTNMSQMFERSRVTSLDVSGFDTSNVTNMNRMFYNCSSTILDVSNFHVNNVTSMNGTFSLTKAEILDVSNWVTTSATDMRYLFNSSSVKSLDLGNFDTTNVTMVEYMFSGCKLEGTLDLSNFNTSKVRIFNRIFYLLEVNKLILNNWETSSATDMSYMFSGSDITTLVSDMSTWDMSKVTDASYMFAGIKSSSLPMGELPIGGWDTSKLTSISSMFKNCILESLDISSWNLNSVTTMNELFSGSTITNLDMSGLSFRDNSNLTRLLSSAKIINLDMSGLDFGDNNLTTLFRSSRITSVDLTNVDTSRITNMSNMFYDTDFISLDLSSFNTSNVTDMSSMFSYSKINILDLSSFDTSKVTNTSYMFSYSEINILDLSSFDTSSIITSTNMFSRAEARTGYARTEEDRVFFMNQSRPDYLTFVVKPMNTNMSNMTGEDLNELFSNLPEVTEPNSINISQSDYTSNCDTTIAIDKGWTVITN